MLLQSLRKQKCQRINGWQSSVHKLELPSLSHHLLLLCPLVKRGTSKYNREDGTCSLREGRERRRNLLSVKREPHQTAQTVSRGRQERAKAHPSARVRSEAAVSSTRSPDLI